MISTQMVKTRVCIIQIYTINNKNFYVLSKNTVIVGPSFCGGNKVIR